jgi:Flp pilus assembly protein TadG
LRDEQAGSTMIEFALLAPVLIGAMLGVFQAGLAVQNYNAVRNVAADVARHAMVQFTIGQPMTNTLMVTYAEDAATGAPYMLRAARLDVTVVDVPTPQVTGTFEKTLTVTYQIPTLLEDLGLVGPSINYSRPVIVTNS